jgi:hypothetical protein
MKRKGISTSTAKADKEMRREYRFAARAANEPLIVMVDPDVAKVFSTPESVNHALRTLMTALPKQARSTRSIGLNRP